MADLVETLKLMDERRERIKERFCRGINLIKHEQTRDGSQDLFDAIGLMLGYYRDYSETHRDIIARLDRIEAALAVTASPPPQQEAKDE